MSIVNKYRIKDNITKDNIVTELKEKHLPICDNGKYISQDAVFHTFATLAGSIEVEIAFPLKLSTWDSFDHVLVMDDDFGQPYDPFYEADENEERRFAFVLNVIGQYNRFMNSLSFLERIKE